MIEVAEALSMILKKARPKRAIRAGLIDALGMILAEDIASDIDSPPHDKSLVDGYAVVTSDLADGEIDLKVLEEVRAGAVPSKTVHPGWATRIMTGAPIPAGADAVVMIEHTQLLQPVSEAQVVRICDTHVSSGQNIMQRATSLARGDVVLRSGCEIRPVEVGLLSEVGRQDVLVIPRADVAVVATGDELVMAADTPADGQIRNSNGPMLCALVSRAGGSARDLGIAPDERTELEKRVTLGLESDVLILSGGVSVGVLDLVPKVLVSRGVQQVFHKVNLKPGKPFWFGVFASQEGEKLVFGLPGNPVSSLVCFELFVRPALSVMAGRPPAARPTSKARLQRNHSQRGDRPTFWPSRARREGQQMCLEPLNWQGSADLRTLADANALVYFPAGERCYVVGDEVDMYTL